MRPIDAEWLKELYQPYKSYNGKELAVPIGAILANIDDAPTIDAVSVVRCGECKHRPIKEDANGDDYGFNLIAPNMNERCPCLVVDGLYSWMPKDDFYCGFGEREGE